MMGFLMRQKISFFSGYRTLVSGDMTWLCLTKKNCFI
jgi:hypothetical protein